MRFEVEINEINKFLVEVDADSPEEASEKALDMFRDAPDEYFHDSDVEVEVCDPIDD